jgi:hypothetical protein
MGAAALCSVASGANPTYRINKGFASTAITRTGAGDYTLTLLDACQLQNEAVVLTGIGNNAFAAIAVEFLTTTTIRTRACTMTAVPAVAAADVDFWLAVFRTGPQ